MYDEFEDYMGMKCTYVPKSYDLDRISLKYKDCGCEIIDVTEIAESFEDGEYTIQFEDDTILKEIPGYYLDTDDYSNDFETIYNNNNAYYNE